VDDCGGGYSESVAEMCDELQDGALPLLCVTPNGRDEAGPNRDCFVLNSSADNEVHKKMFKFLGELKISWADWMNVILRLMSPWVLFVSHLYI